MTDSFLIGMVIWAVEIIATGYLGWKVRAYRDRFPALFLFLIGSALLQVILIPFFLFLNGWYSPYWYVRNVYRVEEIFLFVCVLSDLAGASRKGVIVGVLLALGVSSGSEEAKTLVLILLSLLAALSALPLPEVEQVIAIGVLVQTAIPLIALIKPEVEWLRWVPTVTSLLGLALWAYAIRLAGKPQARGQSVGA